MGLLDFIQQKRNVQTSGEPGMLSDALLTLEDVIAPSGIEINSRSINISGS